MVCFLVILSLSRPGSGVTLDCLMPDFCLLTYFITMAFKNIRDIVIASVRLSVLLPLIIKTNLSDLLTQLRCSSVLYIRNMVP